MTSVYDNNKLFIYGKHPMHEVKSYQMFLYRLEDNLSKITSVERRISMKEGNGLNAADEKRLLKELIEKQTLIVRKLIDDLGIQVEDSDYKERNRIAKRILKALS